MENVKIGSVVYLNADSMSSFRKYFTVIGYNDTRNLYAIIHITDKDEVIELNVPAKSLSVAG